MGDRQHDRKGRTREPGWCRSSRPPAPALFPPFKGGFQLLLRLRQRLAKGGDGLLDHELIEYLLAPAIPRRDTKPLARLLLREFGGIGGLMAADWQAIARVPGMGDTSVAAIKIVQATALRMLRNDVAERPVLGSWQALLDYLRADMAYLHVERVRVLHLNSRNMLIRDENMGDGSIDQAAIYTREVIKRAMELGSAALILVHNYPVQYPTGIVGHA